MALEAVSAESVELPSADLLLSAYQAVRPHMRPEDVPSATSRDVRLGTLGHSNVSPGAVPQNMGGTSPADLHFLPLRPELGQKRTPSTLNGVPPRPPGPPSEPQHHERVIQHRDRSTTYTGGGLRCLRTDGKDWRCKREALPEQKYCEKHQHRGQHRSRKRRRRGEEERDLEAERLFGGWNCGRKKLQLWPGLCPAPPDVDTPLPSHRPTSEQALFQQPSRQGLSSEVTHRPLDGCTKAQAGPMSQWTPAQQMILKATLSELGLDTGELAPSSHDTGLHLCFGGEIPRPVGEGIHSIEAPDVLAGRLRPLLPQQNAPNILRVGADQLILPPTSQVVPFGDGSFSVRVPIPSLSSLGIGVKGDTLVSTWGQAGLGAPIYIRLGGSSELVRLEALQRDGDTVMFRGRPQMVSLPGGEATPLLGPPAEISGTSTVTAVPKAGAPFVSESAAADGHRGLGLDLNLNAPALERDDQSVADAPAAPVPSGPLDSDNVRKVLRPRASGKPPLSPTTTQDLPVPPWGSWPQENRSHPLGSIRTPALPPARRSLDTLHAEGLLNILHQLQLQQSGMGKVPQQQMCAPPPGGGVSGLQRTASLSLEKHPRASPLARSASLPVAFGAGTRLAQSHTSMELADVRPGIRLADFELAMRAQQRKSEVPGGLLGGSVASVIIQTPQGVFLEGGKPLDVEGDWEGSCGEIPGSRKAGVHGVRGEDLHSGIRGDSSNSASSGARGRTRRREGGGLAERMGSSSSDLTGSIDSGLGGQVKECNKQGTGALDVSLSIGCNWKAGGALSQETLSASEGSGVKGLGLELLHCEKLTEGDGGEGQSLPLWQGSYEPCRGTDQQLFLAAACMQRRTPNGKPEHQTPGEGRDQNSCFTGPFKPVPVRSESGSGFYNNRTVSTPTGGFSPERLGLGSLTPPTERSIEAAPGQPRGACYALSPQSGALQCGSEQTRMEPRGHIKSTGVQAKTLETASLQLSGKSLGPAGFGVFLGH